ANYSADYLRHHSHPDDASARGIHLWMARRSIWPSHPFDDRYRFLFARRIADCLRAEFRNVSTLARPFRDRDGRRMGLGRVARDGIVANARAWFVLRNFAARLCLRVSPGRA